MSKRFSIDLKKESCALSVKIRTMYIEQCPDVDVDLFVIFSDRKSCKTFMTETVIRERYMDHLMFCILMY